MIVIQPAIKALLLEAAPVSERVGGSRIYPDVMPQYTKLPGPTLVMTSWIISTDQASDGPTGFEAHRLQLDAYAQTRQEAEELMEASAEALSPRASGTPLRRVVDGVEVQAVRETPSAGSPTYEKETNLYRRSLDFMVHAGRAA